MVVEPVNEIVEMKSFQVLLGILIVGMGVNGVLNPGTWTLTQVPLLSQVTAVLPDIIHQLVGGLVAVAGLTQVNMELDLY